MCRLFGLLSTTEVRATPWLVGSDNSLLRQSHVNPEHIQGDGWGIAWWKGSELKLVRGAAGAFEHGERERFERAAGEAQTPLVIAHLRKASNPMKLPREELLGPLNSQPYAHGKVLFAHNGSIPLPRETRAHLGKYAEAVQGVNDSEVFFYLLLHCVDQEGEVPRGYARAARILRQVWEENGKPGKFAYSGLNVIFARGPEELWALCHYTGEHGKSIGGCDCPYYQMSYREEPGRVIASSEPMDSRYDEWKPLVNGTYLHAALKGRRLSVSTGKLPLESP